MFCFEIEMHVVIFVFVAYVIEGRIHGSYWKLLKRMIEHGSAGRTRESYVGVGLA
jgi:hypothetical protein